MKFTSTAVAALALATAASAQIEFSVDANLDNMIGGLTFRDGDVVSYDTGSDTASIAFNEDLFGGLSVDITAYHRLANGNYLLSVLFNGRTLGGLTFDDGAGGEPELLDQTLRNEEVLGRGLVVGGGASQVSLAVLTQGENAGGVERIEFYRHLWLAWRGRRRSTSAPHDLAGSPRDSSVKVRRRFGRTALADARGAVNAECAHGTTASRSH